MGAVIAFPRAATFHNVATPRGSVYDRAYEAVKTATDWPTKLGLAQTLSESPDWTHTALARHIRTAYSLHREGLLNPVDPAPRDRSDMVDGWRGAALEAEAAETPVKIAMRYRPELLALGAGGALAVAAAVVFARVVL